MTRGMPVIRNGEHVQAKHVNNKIFTRLCMYVQIWPDDRNSHSHYEYKKTKLEGLNM